MIIIDRYHLSCWGVCTPHVVCVYRTGGCRWNVFCQKKNELVMATNLWDLYFLTSLFFYLSFFQEEECDVAQRTERQSRPVACTKNEQQAVFFTKWKIATPGPA